MGNWLRYVGTAIVRLLTHQDLQQLGAEASVLEKLGENKAVVFAKGVAQHVDEDVARFIAGHPALQDEFHTLSADEIAAEQAQRTGNSGGTSTTGSPSDSQTSEGDTGASSSSSSSESAPPATDQTATGGASS